MHPETYRGRACSSRCISSASSSRDQYRPVSTGASCPLTFSKSTARGPPSKRAAMAASSRCGSTSDRTLIRRPAASRSSTMLAKSLSRFPAMTVPPPEPGGSVAGRFRASRRLRPARVVRPVRGAPGTEGVPHSFARARCPRSRVLPEPKREISQIVRTPGLASHPAGNSVRRVHVRFVAATGSEAIPLSRTSAGWPRFRGLPEPGRGFSQIVRTPGWQSTCPVPGMPPLSRRTGHGCGAAVSGTVIAPRRL